jgi:hypothetical protein
MLKIDSWLEYWLPTQPEYRMGYQKVIATFNTGRTERGVIINSQVFLKDGEYPWQMLMDWNYIQTHVQTETLKSNLFVKSVQLIPREPETLKGVRYIAFANEKFHVLANRKEAQAKQTLTLGGTGYYSLIKESQVLALNASNAAAEDAPITLTEFAEIFKRFSAYTNDKRVTPGKGLQPGTFATTKEDADANIKTGTDAVQRYALPNSKPASNVFTITPPKDTEVKRGTAQPANNQPGGGVEIIFVNGSPDGTVTGPVTIPDK